MTQIEKTLKLELTEQEIYFVTMSISCAICLSVDKGHKEQAEMFRELSKKITSQEAEQLKI